MKNITIQPKKTLGQHWLDDDASLQAICDAAEVRAGDTVLEIGPGTGNLTQKLLASGAEVIAVEKDKKLANKISHLFHGREVNVIPQDILQYNFSKLPKDYKIVANIPYYLTNHLLRLLSETPNQPIQASLLVQKEVAERVTAGPGDMSILAVATQFYYEVKTGKVIKAELFTPPPKVDSQVLALKRRSQPPFPGWHPGKEEEHEFFRIVKAGFSARRKKLRSSLSGGLGISKTKAEQLLDKTGIDPNLRAQNLSLDDWHKLYSNYTK